MESKCQMPSVIARLMGLDELPTQQPVCRPCHVLSENYLQKSASIGLLEKRSYHESHSFKVEYKAGKEFIDLFEVPAVSPIDRQSIHSIQMDEADSRPTEATIPFLDHLVDVDTKHLCMEGKPRYSKEFDDVVEELGRNKDLLPRYLLQQDSTSMNHLNCLQSDHVKSSKSSKASYNITGETSRNSERKRTESKILSPRQKIDNDYCGDCGLDNSYQWLKSQLKLKDDAYLSSSRIIVLKPDLAKAQKISLKVPDTNHVESSKIKSADLNNQEQRKTLAGEKELSRHSFKAYRDFANGLPRQMVHSSSCNLAEGQRTELRVREISINEAETDQESRARNLKNQFGSGNHLISKGGDAELGSPSSISSRDGWKEFSKRFRRSESLLPAYTTAGFSECRDGNKAVCQGNNESEKQDYSQGSSEFSGPRFCIKKAQAFNVNSRSNKISQEDHVILDELGTKIEKGDLSQESSTNHSLPGCSIPCSGIEYDQTIQGMMVIQNELEHKLKDFSGNAVENSLFPNSSITDAASSDLDSEVTAIAETKDVKLSSETTEEQQSEPRAFIFSVKHGYSYHIFDAAVAQDLSLRSQDKVLDNSSYPSINPGLPINMGEDRSPTPNSVLEPLLSEENSSGSQCFWNADADPHSLRMQLQLLKSESEETNSEGSGMVVSSDEDSGEESDSTSEGKRSLGPFRAEESRDFSYLVDILDEAGLQGTEIQLDFETLFSPNFPLSSSVIEVLEKKYGKQSSWEKSERRLLFDRINVGLKEILKPDVLTWGKPLRKRFNLFQSREVIEEELWNWLISQENAVRKEEKALGPEVRWFELGDDINLVVCEVERFLLDELAAEIESF
ncbi:hypothetical protein NMG60_11012501 [Bertholletia excelsa]